MDNELRDILNMGVVIPASPLALDSDRKLDERRLRAIYRYYGDSGVGGIAVGVHTTQFHIRDPEIGLFKPVLSIASDEMDNLDKASVENLFESQELAVRLSKLSQKRVFRLIWGITQYY